MGNKWLGRTYGNAGLYAVLIWLLKVIDIRVFYAVAAVFIVPVTLFASPGAHVAYDYYHTKRCYGCLKAWLATYRNHCLFAQTVVDKFAVYAGRTFKFTYEGLDHYKKINDSPNAVLQLGAHIGCAEILGYTLQRKKPYNVLVDGKENASMMGYRSNAFSKTGIRMIPVGEGFSSSEEVAAALDRKEIIGVFADRPMDGSKTMTGSLHGHILRLARGPFSLAVAEGVDVVMVSALKTGFRRYKAFFTPLFYDRSLPMKAQRQQLADAYTAEMERILDRYPLQWFNYIDLWN